VRFDSTEKEAIHRGSVMVDSYELVELRLQAKKTAVRTCAIAHFQVTERPGPKILRILNVLTIKMLDEFTRLHVDLPQSGTLPI
jgi:hypothetical protein